MRSKFLPLVMLAMMLSMTTACAAMTSDRPAFEVSKVEIPGAGYDMACKFTPKGAQKPDSEAASKPELLKPEIKEEAPSGGERQVPLVDEGLRSMHFERGLPGEAPRPPNHFEESQTATHAQPAHRRGAARRWAREHTKRGELRWHRGHHQSRTGLNYPTSSMSPYARSGPNSA